MPNYTEQKEDLKSFIHEYHTNGPAGTDTLKYLAMMQKIVDGISNEFVVDLDDMRAYQGFKDPEIVHDVQRNTKRYLALFAQVVDENLPGRSSAATTEKDKSILDVYIEHRNRLHEATVAQNVGNVSVASPYPPELLRRYDVRILNARDVKPVPIRQIKAQDIGRLVDVRAIVVRTTEVKPVITVATYACDQCNCEMYQEVKGGQFMPQTQCSSETCKQNKNRGELYLQTRGSKFIKFQELKIQEVSEQVPVGHIPRSMTVHVRGELTRIATPGDMVNISGIFLPVPYAGFKAIRAGLLSDTYLEAMNIEQVKSAYHEEPMNQQYDQLIEETDVESYEFYARLAASLCPEIHGHEDLKKVLLLQLIGGVERRMPDGMFIRGDINVLLTGDPGVAKSQLLKFINRIAPRAVYTTGKGSSGVGLTAAVTKDPLTNEMVLEAGALVLADKGICCIDEFDKMDENDRTAIHEVMEQQTVSIAKAGIITTLNARTAILAAANPAFGRFNPEKSASANINLPAALLSRFDIQWLILDRPNAEDDLRVAQHITYVHRKSAPPKSESHDLFENNFIKYYVGVAREFSPEVPEDLVEYIVTLYVGLRQSEAENKKTSMFTSARNLLALLRLSSALARLHQSNVIRKSDIEEAARLFIESKASFSEDAVSTDSADPMDAIYRLIINLRSRERKNDVAATSLKYSDIKKAVTNNKRFDLEQLEECIDKFSSMDVWQLSADKKSLIFLN